MSSIFGTVTTVAILLLMSRDNLQLNIPNYELQITFTITFTISFTITFAITFVIMVLI